jgi:hypothetical protein
MIASKPVNEEVQILQDKTESFPISVIVLIYASLRDICQGHHHDKDEDCKTSYIFILHIT